MPTPPGRGELVGEVGLKVIDQRQAFLLPQLGTYSTWPPLLEPLSVWRARATSHDPLPGLEGEVLEGTCEEWKRKKPGDRKFKEGVGGRGEGAGSTCNAVAGTQK